MTKRRPRQRPVAPTATKGQAAPARHAETPRRSTDRWWGVALGVGAFALILIRFSPHVTFIDGAESAAGVASFGILHAPGYPAFVILGRLFATLVPVGSMAFRVNLFSAVCAASAAGLLFPVARSIGCSRPAAAFAGVALATGASFWFDAGYAKPYALTSLLVVASLNVAVRADERRRTLGLATIGALYGLMMGASFQSGLLSLPLVAYLAYRSGGLRRWNNLVPAALAGMAVVIALGAFIVVRASEHPALAWGEPTNLGRLYDLATMKDFHVVSRAATAASGSATAGARSAGTAGNGRIAQLARLPAYVALEFSIPMLLLCAAGAAFLLSDRRRRGLAIAMAASVALNGVAFALVVGGGGRYLPASDAVIRNGGFLLTVYIVTALVAGLGMQALLDGPVIRTRTGTSRADRRRQRQHAVQPAWLPVAVVLGALAIVSAIATHWRSVSHQSAPFASDYARNVLASLPHGAVLLTFNESSFPLLYEQTANHRRQDVDVVAIDYVLKPWYRDQLHRRFGLPLTTAQTKPVPEVMDIADRLKQDRPVYMDLTVAGGLEQGMPLLFHGLVAELTAGQPPSRIDVQGTNHLLRSTYKMEGIFGDPARHLWPNSGMLHPYSEAFRRLGVGEAVQRDSVKAARDFRLALRIDPGNTVARQDLKALGSG